MTRVAEAKRTSDRSRKLDSETTGWPAPAIVGSLPPESLELYRPQLASADFFFRLDGNDLGKVMAALKFLPEHVPGKVAWCSVVVWAVPLDAAQFGITRRHERCSGNPFRRLL